MSSGRIDLHLHTTASDGILEPAELVAAVVRRGLTAMAITDHDTTEGIDAAISAAMPHPNLLVIPGIELSADVPSGEIHVLGYFLNHHQAELQISLARFRAGRQDRAKRMVEKLAALGMPLDWAEVEAQATGDSIGRPHIAEALVRRGYVGSIREAFDRFISRTGPAYVERVKLTPPEAVRLLHDAGGAPVFAHPAFAPDLAQWLPPMLAAGLAGLETYYPSHRPEMEREFLRLCREHDLIPTSGSDFHGQLGEDESIIGSMLIPEDSVDRLKKVAARNRGK